MGLLDKLVGKPESEDVEIDASDFTKVEFETKEIVADPPQETSLKMPEERYMTAFEDSAEDLSEGSVDIRSLEVREIDSMRDDTDRMLTDLRESMRLNQDTMGAIVPG